MPDAPEVGTKTKKRQRKPIQVWYRSTRGRLFRDWVRFGRYATEAVAQKVVADQRRKLRVNYSYRGSWEFHIGPRDTLPTDTS